MMKLYYFPGACSLADHIVLEWIGAAYDTVKLNRDEVHSPEFLGLNANGTVPVLTDERFVLSQNVAILFYLADSNPDAQLLGDGTPRERAEVLRWLGLLNSDVHSSFKPIFKPTYFHDDPESSKAIANRARVHVREHLEKLDLRLNNHDWLADTRSIADPYLFVMLRWTLKLDIDTGGLHNLSRFFVRMWHDSGVRSAVRAEEGELKDGVRLLT